MIPDTSAANTTCSLAELAGKFIRWRAERTSRGSTPVELRHQAVILLKQHSRAQICRSLGVNSTAFGQWVIAQHGDSAVRPGKNRKKRPTNPVTTDFVELPRTSYNDPLVPPPASTSGSVSPTNTALSDLVVDLPDGTRIVARGASCTEHLLRHLSASRAAGASA
jgi:hypothetical protein